jgi:hypothetical protein
VQLTRCEHIGVHISLCALAKIFVFFEYLPVEFTDRVKLLVGSIFVAVYFVFDLACCGWGGNHSLDVEEIVAARNVSSHFVTTDAASVDLRAGNTGGRVTECDRSFELAIAWGFVEDVMPHLRARRLNAVLV